MILKDAEALAISLPSGSRASPSQNAIDLPRRKQRASTIKSVTAGSKQLVVMSMVARPKAIGLIERAAALKLQGVGRMAEAGVPGYEFTGWSLQPTEPQPVSGPFTTAANVKLFAQWKPKTVTITLNYQGGTAGTTRRRASARGTRARASCRCASRASGRNPSRHTNTAATACRWPRRNRVRHR